MHSSVVSYPTSPTPNFRQAIEISLGTKLFLCACGSMWMYPSMFVQVVLQVVISFIVEAFVLNIQNTDRKRCSEIKKRNTAMANMPETANMSDMPDVPHVQDTDVLEGV